MRVRRGPWVIEAERLIYDNPWMVVHRHDVLHDSGAQHEYTTVSFKNRATGIVPLFENGDVMLVGQYRFPLDRFSWEIPEGGCGAGEEPHQAALREMKEETGLSASNHTEILQLDLSNSITDEKAWCYIAWDLSFGNPNYEETESISLKRVRFSESLDLISKGEIRDAITIASLMRVQLLATQNRLPEPWMNDRFACR